jgi:hypothetical protein
MGLPATKAQSRPFPSASLTAFWEAAAAAPQSCIAAICVFSSIIRSYGQTLGRNRQLIGLSTAQSHFHATSSWRLHGNDVPASYKLQQEMLSRHPATSPFRSTRASDICETSG